LLGFQFASVLWLLFFRCELFCLGTRAKSYRFRDCSRMKLIIAIIQPHHLESVKTALSRVEVFRLTIMDCQGFGNQHDRTLVYGSEDFAGNLRRKIQLQIAVNEEFVKPTIDAIVEGGRSGAKGEIGDGKIFVVPMDDCIRIRTGETGPDAI
jgi:nitrogen regulatory protein P-II 2